MILLDAGPAVLAPMGANLGTKARARLQKMGVEIQLGAGVVDVDREGLTVKDSDGTTPGSNPLARWSAGVSASPLGKQIAASRCRGRPRRPHQGVFGFDRPRSSERVRDR